MKNRRFKNMPFVKDSKIQSAVLQRFESGLLRVSLNDTLGRAPDVLNSRPEISPFARAECAVIALPCVKKRAKPIFSPRRHLSLRVFSRPRENAEGICGDVR